MSKQYDPIVVDEVLFWFDVLQDNSIDNISATTEIERDKVRKILDERFDKVIERFDDPTDKKQEILIAS